MRIRLMQAGFTTFTGTLGYIAFTNGVSDSANPPEDFVRALATVMLVHRITTEYNPVGPVAEVNEPIDPTAKTTVL